MLLCAFPFPFPTFLLTVHPRSNARGHTFVSFGIYFVLAMGTLVPRGWFCRPMRVCSVLCVYKLLLFTELAGVVRHRSHAARCWLRPRRLRCARQRLSFGYHRHGYYGRNASACWPERALSGSSKVQNRFRPQSNFIRLFRVQETRICANSCTVTAT